MLGVTEEHRGQPAVDALIRLLDLRQVAAQKLIRQQAELDTLRPKDLEAERVHGGDMGRAGTILGENHPDP